MFIGERTGVLTEMVRSMAKDRLSLQWRIRDSRNSAGISENDVDSDRSQTIQINNVLAFPWRACFVVL